MRRSKVEEDLEDLGRDRGFFQKKGPSQRNQIGSADQSEKKRPRDHSAKPRAFSSQQPENPENQKSLHGRPDVKKPADSQKDPCGQDLLLQEEEERKKVSEHPQINGLDHSAVKVGLPQTFREVEEKKEARQDRRASIVRKKSDQLKDACAEEKETEGMKKKKKFREMSP